MTQYERNQLQRLLAFLPSEDVRLSKDGLGVTVYDPKHDNYQRLAVCYDRNKAALIVACLQLAQELVVA